MRPPAGCRALAPALLGLVVAAVAGCGSKSQNATTTQINGISSLTIYSSLPLQGPYRERSLAIINGEKLALKESGALINGLTIKYTSLDDASPAKQGWDPSVTAANARQAVQDKSTVAYIGDADWGATAVAVPILNEANILAVSPIASYTGLTDAAGGDKGEPDKYYPSSQRTFARIVPNDDVQAGALLDAAQAAGCTKLYELLGDPRQIDQRFLMTDVAGGAAAHGMRLGGQDALGPGSSDYSDMTKKLAAAEPDCVYFTGTLSDQPRAVIAAVHGALPDTHIVVGSALASDAFAEQLTDAEQALTSAVSPVLSLRAGPPAALAFARSYRQTFGVAPEPEAVLGYESMKLVLSAIRAAGKNVTDHQAVIKALLSTHDRASALGTYSITPSGDTTLRDYGLYSLRDGRIVFVRAVTPKPAA